jgi:iron complex transport system substrate-binding protein
LADFGEFFAAHYADYTDFRDNRNPMLRALLVCLTLTACNHATDNTALRSSGAGCIDSFDPKHDYFPDKIQIEFAKNFSVEYHLSYKVVTVRRPMELSPDENYVLVQCGAPRPSLPDNLSQSPVIPVPVQSMFSASATHMPLLVDLGHVEVLTGISEARFVTTPSVLERIRAGEVLEYAPNNLIDTELVISKSPEILMTGGGDSGEYAAIRKAGIGGIDNAEWQEAAVLGRAEWVKYMALFLNEEARAQRVFSEVRDHYTMLQERTRSIPEANRPRVMTGLVNRGAFEIAGGRSYVATLIHDAGGRYIWSDNTSTGFATVTLESQLARAADADVWINGGDWSSLKAMLAEERRYKEFRPYREGHIWFYNRLVSPDGGIDYWSRGTTRPDLILADLIKILHPELAADHEFVWYKQVLP